MTSLTCREVTELQAGDRLWTQWRDLLTRVAPELSIFGPEWFSIWSQTHGAADRWTGSLRLLAVIDEADGLRGLMTLSEQNYAGIRIKASAGYFQPWRCILADRDCERDIGRALGDFVARSGWLLCQLGPFRRSSAATASFLDVLNAQKKAVVTKNSAQLAVCRSPAAWEDYKQNILGGKFFRKIGNYERKMERAGRTEIEHIRRPNPERTQTLVADLAQIEQHSWLVKSARGKTRFTSPVAQRFWTRLIDEALSPQDRFDAWIIRFNDRPVSFCLTLTALPTRYVIANQYDEAVADYRTGSTLYRHMIEEGIARGVRTFDFGDGGIEYKQLWGAEYVDTVETLLVAPHPLTSRLLPLAHAARAWWQSRVPSTSKVNADTKVSNAENMESVQSAVASKSPHDEREETLLSSANELIETCDGGRSNTANAIGSAVIQA